MTTVKMIRPNLRKLARLARSSDPELALLGRMELMFLFEEDARRLANNVFPIGGSRAA